MDPKSAKMYVQGTSQQRPWKAAGKVYKMRPNCLHLGSRGEPKGIKLEAPEPCEKQVCFQEPPRGIRTLSKRGGVANRGGSLTGRRGGPQEVGGGPWGRTTGGETRFSHAVDPKGLADPASYVLLLLLPALPPSSSSSSSASLLLPLHPPPPPPPL